MAYAISQMRRASTVSVEGLRMAIVGSCAMALIAAGQVLPL